MKASTRTIGSWITAGLILWATISLASAGHKYMPDELPLLVAASPCVQPVDLLKEVRAMYPDEEFGVKPIFRYDEAKVFGEMVGQKGAHSFYVLVAESSNKWVIFAANKQACVLLLNGENATKEKFSQIRGIGLEALNGLTSLIEAIVAEDKARENRREPTV